MQQQAIPSLLLTIDETAQALRMSRSSVYREIFARRLRSLKIGGKRRVSVQALYSYISMLEEESGAWDGDEEITKAVSANAPMAVGRLALPSLTANVNLSTDKRGKRLPNG